MITRTITNAGDPIVDGLGRPAKMVKISFLLVDELGAPADGWDVLTGERITPGPIKVITNAIGEFTVNLWPTSRGDRVLFWKCTVGIDSVTDFQNGLAEGSTLQWISFRFGGVTPTPGQYALWSIVTGGVATKAILDSVAGAYVDGQCLYVTNDPTTSLNGLWRKQGSAWVQGAVDRVTNVETRVTNIEFSDAAPWIDPEQLTSVLWTTAFRAVAKAIKAVYISAPVPGEVYTLITFCNNDATFHDNIIIFNAAGVKVAEFSGTISPKTAGALNSVTLTSVGSNPVFTLLIDYNAPGLTNGVLVNGNVAASPFKINPFTEQQRIDARLRPVEATVSTHTSQITTLQSRTGSDNRIANGNLSNSGEGVAWNAGGAAAQIATVAYSDLTSRGITTAAKFSKALVPASTYLYIIDSTMNKNDGGKYLYSTCYVYSEDGTNWPTSMSFSPFDASGPVSAPGLTSVYTQISANLRKYIFTGLLPAAIYTRGMIGGVPSTLGNVYISGFSWATSRYSMTDVDLKLDQWTLKGVKPLYDLYEEVLTDEARIAALEAATIFLDNQVVNGNLSNNGQGVTIAASPATNHIVATAISDFTSRGIDYALQYSKAFDAALAYVYKQDLLPADAAGKYIYASVYIYSEDGTNWGSAPLCYAYAGGTNVGFVGAGSSGNTQINANLRKYWFKGQFTAGYTYTMIRFGNVPATSGNVYMSGFTFAIHEEALLESNVKADQWLLNGPTTLYETFDRLIVDEARITSLETTVTGLGVFNPGRPLRISLTGSSITWGSGYMGEESFVGEVESRIRTLKARTVHGKDMTLSGTNSVVNNKLYYGGQVLKLSGVNAYAQTSIYGDEFSISIGRERKNAGAAVIELYVDGVLFDTFSTYNKLPSGSTSANFTGDGTTKLFDLGKAFTYNHATTVGGVAKTGSLNVQGYGGAVPGGQDYMVVKQYATVGGIPEVHHYLDFAAAPANGAAIVCSFDYGETVNYAKTTIGNTGQGINTALESAYGLGSVSFDPANPSSISSGMDFRQTDKRSVLTWRFSTATTRTFKLSIKALDTRATAGTPELYLNFATNRMFYFQNAGIGGWTADLLATDTGLRTVKEIKEFNPDIVLLESGTNDDWNAGNIWTAYVTKTGLSEAAVKALGSSLHLQTITFDNPTYTVQDSRVPVTAITSTSATLDGTNATFNLAAGDVIILGDYKGDTRRTAARVVSGWNSGTRVVTWNRPVSVNDLIQISALSDLVGTTAQVRRLNTWATAVTTALDSLETDLPGVVLGIVDMGPPNFDARRLIGYPEKSQALIGARSKPCLKAKTYKAVETWQYGQKKDVQLYLNNANSTTSTGAASYILYKSGGAAPTERIRNISVTVDGIERNNDGTCFVAGGYAYNWGAVSPLTINNDAEILAAYTLTFSSNVPAAGAVIIVKFSSVLWSGDLTHPTVADGNKVFGETIFETLVPVL